VIYDCDKYADTPEVMASKKMFSSAGVKTTPYKNSHRKIEIEL
jgi:dCMP deaminase